MTPTRRSRWVAALGLTAAWATFFTPAIAGGGVFYFRDLFFFHRPLREALVRALAAGQAPFLNPGLNLGQPMLADPSYAVFYPANLVYLLLPFDAAWNVVLAGHVLWGSAGAYRLARALGCGRVAGVGVALVFSLGGPMASSVNYYSLLVGASWVPWGIWAAWKSWTRGGRWTAAAGVALALQALAGEPTVAAVTWLIVAAGWGVGLLRADRRVPLAVRGVAIAVVAVLLAAPQVVPTLLWLPWTDRGTALPFRESAAWWSLHPVRLAEMVVPGVEGNPMGARAEAFWGGFISDAGFPYLPRIYVGLLPLLLAPLAWRRAAGRAPLAVAVVFVVLALGHHLPVYRLLHETIPVLAVTRYPEKFLLFASLGLALAFGVGCEALRDGRRRVLVPLATGLACLAVVVALAVGTFGVPARGLTAAQEAARSASLIRAGIVVAVTTAMTVAAALVGPSRHVWITALVAGAVFDVGLVTRDVPATRPATVDGAIPGVLARVPELRQGPLVNLGEARPDAYFGSTVDPYVAMQEGLFPYSGLRWGVSYGATADIARSMSESAGRRFDRLLPELPTGGAANSLARWGVAHVVAPFQVDAPGIDPSSVERASAGPAVYVHTVAPRVSPLVVAEGAGRAPRWSAPTPHRLVVDLDGDDAVALVVTRDAIPGWSARVDGTPAEVGASPDGLLRVALIRGARRVELVYEPPGLRAGLLLGGCGGLAAIALALIRGRRPRPRPGS